MSVQHRPVENWSLAPSPEVRAAKTRVERELLIKVSPKSDVIELNPLILSTRLDKPVATSQLKYYRIQPPFQEISPYHGNPWTGDRLALRQLTNPARRGPRDIILPNLVKHPVHVKIEEIPPYDTSYQAKQTAAQEQLTHLLKEWSVYNRVAFPVPSSRQSVYSDLDPKRRVSKGSLLNLAKSSLRRASNISLTSSGNSSDKRKASHGLPRSRKKRNRWKAITREVIAHNKAAMMQLPEDMSKSELRIYVSSTPDLQEEREFLEEVAYPRLRELCEKMGLNCHVVDMRNGAGILTNDIETFDLIEKELRHCRTLSIGPCFVSLVGHSLDDQTLPGFLHKQVYEEIRETLIREDIIGVEALDDVYRLDSNRIPPVYTKQRITSLEDYQSPEEVEQVLHEALVKAVEIIRRGKSNEDLLLVDFYKWSAVVKELEEGLLTNHNPRSDTLCFMMDADLARESVKRDEAPILRLRHNVYQHYRQYASKDNLVSFKTGKKNMTYLRSISDTFVSGVASLLKSQISHRDYDVTQELTEGCEILQHVKIALNVAEMTPEQQSLVGEVKAVMDDPQAGPRVVVLWGQNGTGKTTVASHIARACQTWEPRRKVFFRCLGSTLRSSSLDRVLESLIRQISFSYGLNIELPADLRVQELLSIFLQAINTASAKRSTDGDLLIVLDQLGKLDLDPHILLSILNSLTPGVTLLITLTTPSHLINVLKSKPNVTLLSIPYWVTKQVGAILTLYLEEAKRVLTVDQLQTALSALPADTTPLCAMTIFHIVRWWPSHTLPVFGPFSGNAEDDFDLFLQLLEADLGKAFTRYALSFLGSARHGLSDQELLHLLSKDSVLLDEIKEEEDEFVSVVEGFPYQLQLSRLMARLGKFIVDVKLEGETIHLVLSRALIKAISSRYVKDSFFYSIHQKLANFFLFIRRGLLLSSRDISEQKHKHLAKYHWRTLRCVPYHLSHSSPNKAEVWEVLKEKVFFNFSWLVNEIYSGFFNDLLDDIRYSLETVSLDSDILYFQQLLLSLRHTVIHNPISLAAVFSSLKADDLLNVKDSVSIVIHEARQWLKQVHLQALVPVSYTSDKINRLLIKENSIFGASDVHVIPGTSKLLVCRKSTLTILNSVTKEEVVLAAMTDDVDYVHVVSEESVVVLSSSDSSSKLDILNLQTGTVTKSIPLGKSSLSWFHINSPRFAYFASEMGVKCVDLDVGAVNTILPTRPPWLAATVSESKPDKIITAVVEDNKLKIESILVKDIMTRKSVYIKNESPNRHTKPLLSTKDGKFIIYLSEKQATVVDCSTFKVTDTFSLRALPIIRAELSRSHEHVFMSHVSGEITCHVLYSGNQVMSTRITPKPQPQLLVEARRRERTSSRNSSSRQVDAPAETITTMVTSEDDHFLLCGTTTGHVYVIHVPTGVQLVAVTTNHVQVRKVTFLTNSSHFQHVITTDVTGVSRHWNLRPLFKQARQILHPCIQDEDLRREEERKLELNSYFSSYEDKKSNRIFLNGPDIASFYKTPPDSLFDDLDNLDPSFGIQNDWEITGFLADVSDHLIALTCGKDLGDVILTVSEDFRLARWSLHDGTLVWSRKLPCQGGEVLDLTSLYYDQAVLVVEKSRAGKGLGVSVIYTGEGQNKMLSRDQVTSYWTSKDKTCVALLCEDRSSQADTEPKFYLWDLIKVREDVHGLLVTPASYNQKDKTTIFKMSPSLTQIVCFSLPTAQGAPLLALFNSRSDLSIEGTRQGRQWKDDNSIKGDNSKNNSFVLGSEDDVIKGNNSKNNSFVSANETGETKTLTGMQWTRVISRNETNQGDGQTKKVSVHSRSSGDETKSEFQAVREEDEHLLKMQEVTSTEVTLPLHVTSFCYIGEESILLGTSSRHLLLIDLPTFKPICILGKNGPRFVSDSQLTSAILKDCVTAHNYPISDVMASEDGNTLVSSDRKSLSVWNAKNRTLSMTVWLNMDEEISFMVISKDAAIITMVINERIIRVWTPIEKRELASHMTTFDVTELHVASDCRKVIVRGRSPECKPVLEIFDIRNIDDVLLQMAGRKISQQQEIGENLVSERVKKTSRVMQTRKTSALQTDGK